MAFDSILGQDKAIRLLTRAVASERLGHAYLLLGPDGVGKALSAKELTALLFCDSEEAKPCGHCRGCHLFSAGNHPDFIHIFPDGASIKIKQIRELKEKLSFAPLEAAQRIVIIEEAQRMGREAANSLLKLLEEPLAGNLLLLVAADNEPMLPTIASRCQIVPFTTLDRDTTAAIIRRADPTKTPQEAATLAALSEGSPGLALAMNSQSVVPLYHDIIDGLIQTGQTRAKTVEKALELAGLAARSKDELELLFDLLANFYKELQLSRLAPGRNRENEKLRAMTETERRERWNLQALSDKLSAVVYAKQALNRNCNRSLVCETLFLKLLQ